MGCLVTAHVTRLTGQSDVQTSSLPSYISVHTLRYLPFVISLQMVKRELSASDDEDELLLKTESELLPGSRHRVSCESKPSIHDVDLVVRQDSGSRLSCL
jgi:hypothetical protein